ncbi:HNH endonuclease [Herbiconiux daphne]|uniref:HNH endonuclease n=1 Tax=Herbiconiux daphne TaxID=2970914 RepID=A0ABT2HB85_9MICO|nr:HNH endonuclease [Herbiconiux daphne]MCS5737233.1 HNH endonuclease [Herbiconiux daphne]
MFDVKALFDYHEGDLLWRISPSNNVKVGDKAGTRGSDGYWRVSINDRLYLVHRIIYLWHNGYVPGVLDHIDRNTENNRIENLRASCHTLNGFNRGANKNSKSGIKGVSFDKARGKWKAQLKFGEESHSKRCDSMEEAISWVENLRNKLGIT